MRFEKERERERESMKWWWRLTGERESELRKRFERERGNKDREGCVRDKESKGLRVRGTKRKKEEGSEVMAFQAFFQQKVHRAKIFKILTGVKKTPKFH